MQLFRIDSSLEVSAVALDDARLNCQIKECAQIASTGFWKNDCGLGEILTSRGFAYLPSHENHPLCIWSGQNHENMRQVIDFGFACAKEKFFRTGNYHKSEMVLKALQPYIFQMKKLAEATQTPNATTNSKHIKNVFIAYQNELTNKWRADKRPPVWTYRCKPSFACKYLTL